MIIREKGYLTMTGQKSSCHDMASKPRNSQGPLRTYRENKTKQDGKHQKRIVLTG